MKPVEPHGPTTGLEAFSAHRAVMGEGVRYTVTTSYVQVIGDIWQPDVGPCAMRYTLDSYDLENIAEDRRVNDLTWAQAVDSWLGTNAGDFQSIIDFHADIESSDEGRVVLDWKNEDSELTYNDCVYGEEE